MLTWTLLNFVLLIGLRRPGVSAALALALIAALIALSQFKYGITQLTLTFLDFLIIVRDTFSFLHSVFPQLRTQLLVLAAVAVPVLWVIWRADPFRCGAARRWPARWSAPSPSPALSVGVSGAAVGAVPGRQPHLSNLARSGRGVGLAT